MSGEVVDLNAIAQAERLDVQIKTIERPEELASRLKREEAEAQAKITEEQAAAKAKRDAETTQAAHHRRIF